MGPQEETTISSTSQDLTECVDDDHIPASGSHHNTDGDNPAVDVFRGSRTRVGARERHVGQGFWAFVEDKNLTDQLSIPRYLFYNEPEGEPFMPPSYISSFALAKLLTRLPTKPVCDALLQAFLVRVYPIYPLINPPTFIPQYQLFWQLLSSGNSEFLACPKLLEDPTYVCVIWAIMFAGSSALSFAEWNSAPFNDLDQLQTIDQLQLACSESLIACRHTDHPTLNSLTASIIAYHFDVKKGLSSSLFVTTTQRLAHSMGLHLDASDPQLNSSSAEHNRRIWWHIVWLDLQTSVATGLPTCCSETMIETSRMISDLRYTSSNLESMTSCEITSSEEFASEISMIMIHAIGKFRTAKLQHQMIGLFQRSGEIQARDIRNLVKSMKESHILIDELIAKIPVHGIPEKGMIPSCMTNVSPAASPDLYEDRASEPTVWSTCARIALSLYKLESVIMLQHALLPDLDSMLVPHSAWNRIIRLCLAYMRCYLQLCQVPAFNPYSWFWSSYSGPRRCTFLILHFLINSHSEHRDRQEMLFYVDEFITYWGSVSILIPIQCESALPPMNMLAKMRQQLEQENNCNFDQNVSINGSMSERRNAPRDIDYLEDLFDSEYWASLA
ncbi:hypothetical protein N7533_006908 [Penicillium manginii]|jgi:hypothetical protein|uniref:uncharacterized protein n=1 Tax=Penicillium manginii TaxID=203109 RepID=UPI00254727F6|nr:uncharacterized protein N7533_006908 [Penicillium manginii]KAJ5749880.1 hypothetical protein N7533_006908 [Penicillium manginii]